MTLKSDSSPPRRTRFEVRVQPGSLGGRDCLGAVVAFFLALLAAKLPAATLVWDVSSGDGAVISEGAGTWQVGLPNWNDAGADVNWTDGNDAVFGGGTLGAAGLVTLGSAISVSSLTFDPPNGGGSYTIDTSTFGLTLNGGVTANHSATIQSGIGGSVDLTGTFAWSVAAVEELTVSSIINGSSVGLTKIGDGTLTLTGANTFTGPAAVDAGTLRVVDDAITITNASATRAYGPIASGATLEFNYTGAAAISNAGIVNLNGGGTFKKTGSGNLTQISGGANIAMDSGALIWIAEGSYIFGAQGVGNWESNLSDFRVDAGATYQGGATPTVVDALDGAGIIIVGGGNGTVTQRNGFTLGVDNGSGTFSGTLTNNNTYGPNSIRKEGTGTQILSGNNDYDGITTIVEGVLQIGDGVAATGTLGTGDTVIGTVDTVTSASLVFDHTGDHAYNGDISGTGTVTKNGSGSQALNGTNTYTGATQVNAGTLFLGGTNTSVVTVASGANLGGEGSTTGDMVFQGTHTLVVDANPTNALSTSANLDVNAATITIDVTGTGADAFDVIRYGTINGGVGNFTLGAHTLSGRVGSGVIADSGTAITLDLGFRTNTWKGNDATNPSFWDIDTTANWNNSTDSVFFDGDAPVFDDTAASFNPILQTNAFAGAVTFNNDTNAYTLGDMGGGETLTINNGLYVNSAASLTLDAGIVSNSTATFANSGVVNVLKPFANNGAINITGNGDINLSGLLSGTGPLVKGGSGTTLITGDNNGYTGTMTVNEGTLVLQNTAINSNRSYGPIATGSTLEFRMTAGGASVGVLNISGGGTFLKTGTQTLSQTSAGATIAMDSGGLFHLAEGAYTFGAGGIGTWTNNLGDLLMGPGTTFTGSATPIVFDAVNGEGTMSFGGGLTLGNDNGDGTFTGAIIDATANLNGNTAIRNSIVKNGSGTQVLSGANTYSGATTINGGLLVLEGTLGGNITVAAGANIGGEASTTGNVVFQGATHTLEVNSESLIALGSTGAGGLDIGALGVGGLTVNIDGTGPSPVNILTYGSGGFTGGVDRFTLGTHQLSSRLTTPGAFTDTGSAITIDLGFAFRTWNNASADGLWNQGTGSSANWVEGDNTFFDLDSAIFDDTLSGAQVVTLDETVSATRVRFDNSTGNDYIINGNLGRTLSTSFAITFQGSGNTTINADIAGGSQIRQSGTGISTLGGNNTFTGDVIVSNGTLRAGSNTGLSTGDIAVDGTGATLEVADGVSIANTITIGNTGDAKRLGLASGATSGTMSGNILSNNTTIGNFEVTADTGGTLSLTGIISGTGGVEKVGLGTVELTGANTYGGQTVVTEGTLRLVNDAIGASGGGGNNYNIASGATLEINRTTGNPFGPAINWTGGGTFLKTGGSQFTQTSGGATVALGSGALIHIAQGIYQFGGAGIGNWSGNLADFRVDAGARYIAGATPTVVNALDGAGIVDIGGNGGTGFTVGVDDGSGTFDGVLQDAGFGAGNSFIKQGTGTQVLNGNNVSTGSYEVQAGRLDINGTNVAAINVAAGANLGGEGSTTGNLTFLGTTHTLDINASTVAALGSTGAGGTDVNALNVGGFTVNISGSGAGAIKVLTYGSGGFTGAVDRFTLGTHTPSARGAGSFMDNGVDAITIDLGYVTNTWIGGDATNPTFWDVATTANWNNSADAGFFQQGDDVVFGDGASNFNPTLQSNIAAGSVVFTNTAPNSYTLSAASGQKLTTSGTFDLAGSGVTVNADVETAGGFISSGAGTMALNGVISGAGDFVKSGTGTTTLSGANTYTGQTRMTTGTLILGADNVIPDGSTVVHSGSLIQLANGVSDTIHSYQQTGGTLDFAGVSELTVLNDSTFTTITIGTTGTLRTTTGTTTTVTGSISQLGGPDSFTIDAQGDSVVNVLALINDGDGDGAIHKTGTGTVRFTNDNNNYGGGNRFEEGTVEFTSIANYNARSSLGDGDTGGTNTGVIQIGTATTAATLRMINTNTLNTSNRAFQLGAAGATIDVHEAAQTLTLNGVVSDHTTTGNLTKEGVGGLVLGGANTYTGSTTVNEGVLQIDGDSSAATGAVTVGANGTLAGTGTIGGTTSVITGGVIRPGTSGGSGLGTLTFNMDLDVAPGSLVFTGIDATSRGTSYDAINVVGTLTLDGSSTILFTADTGFAANDGDTYDLLDWTTLTSTGFDVGTDLRQGGTGGGNLSLPDLSSFGLFGWSVSDFLTSGTVSIVIIPEPSRVCFLFFGVACLVLRRRRLSV